ncbi:FAD-dependent oxidoreductase [Microbacterium hydrocarbonoxydans]|uniref:FAD-dependent oxidoreductase n=1 Tax=Microbacterium hydrocarbonoxydans TaxID=273678 RepID=UPI00203C1B3F|nr:NAD(P)/FAD-dependent oxidoreductase [Microbacterium hydrocarbonoxydans]MCM3778419.1 FAD-dependent monooxygenase [Microbacterium hydrocarbonoxydans]
MRVIVSGAGLGGLVLAHALRDHAEVVVVDRDAHPGDTGGYRIALTPEAVAVVEQHVPARLVDRIRSVSDGPRTFSQFTIADSRLRPIVVAPEPPGQDRMLCQRRALRQILAEGLGDSIRFASTVTSAEAHAEGASVTLTDGTRIDGDLVVAADGARSATLRRLAPETSADTGLVGIAGSTPLGRAPRFPRYLDHGPALAVDRFGTGMFLSLTSRGLSSPPADLADAVGPPSLVWGLIARRDALPDVRDADPEELAATASVLVRRWHPWLQDAIAASAADRTAAFSFRAADPSEPRFPWSPCRITAIGDAVHAMPPTGGRAGSTAIRSAGALADALIAEADIDVAVARYQSRVNEWARPAILESLGPVRVITALRHPLAQLVAGPALGVAGAVGAALYRLRVRGTRDD